jgi:hypothetical protein
MTQWCTISQQEVTDLSRCKHCLESKADGTCDHLITKEDSKNIINIHYGIKESDPTESEDTLGS